MLNEQTATPAENGGNTFEPETDVAPETMEQDAEQPQDVVEPEQEPALEPDEERSNRRDHDNRVQKRIDKLTREKYELKGRLDALEQMYAQQIPSDVSANDNKPAREMFPSDEAYVEALTDWKLEQRLPHKMQELAGQQQESAMQYAFLQKEAAVRKDYADYDNAIAESADVRIPADIVPSIITSEYGPDIRYYLAKNPDVAQALNHVPPYVAIKEIGRIEAAIAAQRYTAQTRNTRQTKTPPPIAPVRSGDAAQHDLDKLPMKDFIKRREQMRKDLHKH